jgi:tripartite-type tricarboxylate transporter receptor subunit TctC
VAVRTDFAAQTIAEFIAQVKANPGKLSYGTGNSTGQIVGETLKKRTGIDLVRVAYRSNPTAMTDLLAGHIQMMVPDMTTGLPQVKAGKIRPLATLTKARQPLLPDVPTLHETVMPEFETLAWAGVFGPAGMPPEAVTTLTNAIQKILARPDAKERFLASGVQSQWQSPQELGDFVKAELVKYTAMIKEAGIEPE